MNQNCWNPLKVHLWVSHIGERWEIVTLYKLRSYSSYHQLIFGWNLLGHVNGLNSPPPYRPILYNLKLNKNITDLPNYIAIYLYQIAITQLHELIKEKKIEIQSFSHFFLFSILLFFSSFYTHCESLSLVYKGKGRKMVSPGPSENLKLLNHLMEWKKKLEKNDLRTL